MNFLELINEWFSEHPVIFRLVRYLLWTGLILFLIFLIRRLLQRKLPDTAIRYKSQKGVEILGYLLIVFLTISYFTGNIKDLGLALGLLTAGITITLQELILSITGSFFIFLVRVYKPGDRIEINGIKGDVIDIDSIYTTMMEIGEWVSSDNYSGRIVKLSNAFVFKGPVYNYSRDFPFVWDEFNIPIRYGSDVELAKTIIIQLASETLNDFVQESLEEWKQVVGKYYIEDAQVEPTLAISLTDNWIQINLRYIVDYKKRRMTKHRLSELVRQRLEATNGKVQLGSTTVEIIRIPPIETKHEK